MSTSIPVATWTLGATTANAAESALNTAPLIQRTGAESVIGPDLRKPVKLAEITPGGKYYSIVKLQIKYEHQDPEDTRYAMGTGWLIAPDLLVTAGHCAYDHQYEFGRATEVKAYVGYHGKEFVGVDENVQFRRGVQIATTRDWITNDVNRANDVSFIRVDSPFYNVQVVKWQKTPTQGKYTLGVVGYPADRNSDSGEQGATMYEMFAETQIDLRTTVGNMLEYQISTYAGQSGSPVLLQNTPQLTSIGAHVYDFTTRHSASVIRGQYGNDYAAYISIFRKANIYQTIATVEGVTYLDVPQQTQEAGFDGQAESFRDAFRKVIDIGAPVAPMILQGGSPFLGPQAAKIAGAVGAAISVANELVKVRAQGAERGLEPPLPYKSHAARAVLAEATLQCLIQQLPTENNMKMYKAMEKMYEENSVHIKVIAKKLGPYLLDPALRIVVADTAPKKEAEPAVMDLYPRIGDASTIKSVSDRKKKAFVEALNNATRGQGAQEGFLDFISPLASLAVNVVGGGISAIAKAIGGAESSLIEGPTASDTLQAHMETLCHRAIMAEAALQAAMEIPAASHEESFFGDLVNTVKKIGGTVIKVAPSVFKAVAPIVKTLTAESSVRDDDIPAQNREQNGQIGKPPVKQYSIGDFLREGKQLP